jgi:opacity protein-like surface antigen
MKRFIHVIVMCVLAALVCELNAQGIIGKGLKLGLNLSTVKGSDASQLNASTKNGFVGGGFLIYGISDQLAIQPEVLYSVEGSDGSPGGQSGSLEIEYLEIPLLMKYYFNTSGSVKPSIMAGPVPAFKLSATGSSSAGSADVSSDIKSFEFGLALGGGADYALQSGKILFDVRYNLGLTKVGKGIYNNFKIQNSVWAVTIGYSF